MAKPRNARRVVTDATCLLSLGNLHHIASVKNISFNGALVHFSTKPPSLDVGDKCNFFIIGEFIREYSCNVVRVETQKIALMFNGMHKVTAAEY